MNEYHMYVCELMNVGARICVYYVFEVSTCVLGVFYIFFLWVFALVSIYGCVLVGMKWVARQNERDV